VNYFLNIKKNLYPHFIHLTASTNCQKEAVELLIKKGASVNEKSSLGFTPLHEASRNGHTEIAELLIKNGANINEKNRGGSTPLYSGNGKLLS
jgi:ankyrin repeat protein